MMKPGWQVFRMMNILEGLVFATFFSWMMYDGVFTQGGKSDLWVLVIMGAFFFTGVFNCINNVLVLKLLAETSQWKLFKKVLFWIGWSVLLIMILIVGFGLLELVAQQRRSMDIDYSARMILVRILLLFTFINGLAIVITQLILFIKIHRRMRSTVLAEIASIGTY